MAKKGQKYRKHSPEFKLSVIMDMRENHLGIMETERKYDVKHNVISKWERIFLEEGAEGHGDHATDHDCLLHLGHLLKPPRRSACPCQEIKRRSVVIPSQEPLGGWMT